MLCRACWLLLELGLAAADPEAVASREADLRALRGEIAQLEQRLAGMATREADLGSQLERSKAEVELQKVALREAALAFEVATARAAATTLEVVQKEAELEAVRTGLRRRLAGLYSVGRHGYLRLLLSLRSGGEALPAVRQLRFLVRRDRDQLARFTKVRDQLAEVHEKRLEEQRNMEMWRDEESSRQRRLLATRRRQEQLLSQVAKERRELAARATSLQEKESKLGALIESLLDGSEPLEGKSMKSFRGALDWPVKGRVVTGFGPRLDPRYKTEVPHNGLGIATEAGSPVRVVFPGEVLFAAPFEGYGEMVVVRHPGRAFSLYAGLEQVRVGQGRVLSLGDVIGTSTERLYFEVRNESQPEDPREWLR